MTTPATTVHKAHHLPTLTRATAPLTCEVEVLNEHGERLSMSIPAERPLTVYVDKRELVTLMTLGAQPELLVLGYLRNQRLISHASQVESITVDWDVGAAAVKTRDGIKDLDEKTARRVVTTGCGTCYCPCCTCACQEVLTAAPHSLKAGPERGRLF